MRFHRKLLWLAVATAATFAAGATLACSGNYCSNLETRDCVVVDTNVEDTCCINPDNTVRRCWTCLRDDFWCMSPSDIVGFLGPGYNCHSPGSACE